MKVLCGVLKVLGMAVLVVGIFALLVFIASAINGVGFYDQLRLWFGAGSAFARIFGK